MSVLVSTSHQNAGFYVILENKTVDFFSCKNKSENLTSLQALALSLAHSRITCGAVENTGVQALPQAS